MQVEEADAGPERRILIGMVCSTPYLNRIMPFWYENPLQSRWSNIVADWVVEFYREQQRAPVRSLNSYYEKWERRASDEDTSRLMNRFLTSLSDEYDRASEIDVDALVSETEQHFNSVKLTKLEESLRRLRQVGDVAGALEVQQEFRPVSFKRPTYIDVLTDRTVALTTTQNVLIKPKGALGEFFGNELAENCFVALAGVVKGSKSFCLLELAWQAMLDRKRVAYFQIGDLTQDQIVWRFRSRAAQKPRYARRVEVPVMLSVESDYATQVSTEPKIFETDLTVEEGQNALARFAGKREYLRLQWYAVGSVTIEDIKAQLNQWDQEGWKAQCVVIDYLENLAPVNKKHNSLESIDYTWTIAKQISEMAPRLVLTAHQTNKEGFKAWVLTRSNFRGNLKVLAHVTGFVGVNHTDEEKRMQAWRLNWMVRRQDMFSESKCVVLASCLDYCQMARLSSFNTK